MSRLHFYLFTMKSLLFLFLRDNIMLYVGTYLNLIYRRCGCYWVL